MLENEELFERLTLSEISENLGVKELVDTGYLTGDLRKTPKANIFIEHFIEELKLPLYIAMRKCHNDMRAARKRIGIKKYITYHAIADELCKEGLMRKDEFGDFFAS